MAPRRARQLHFGLSELGTVSTSVPTKGTTCLTSSNRSRVMFQLPCPRKARRASYLLIPPSSWFQLPCPRRARLVICGFTALLRMFQLPCPRRARRQGNILWVTSRSFNYRAREGHDPSATTHLGLISRFNYRARGGHDLRNIGNAQPTMFQLPCPRRARRRRPLHGLLLGCFNYRARGGHDQSADVLLGALRFQLPCPRRARHDADRRGPHQ